MSRKSGYTPRVKFTGKSGYDYLYDFVIPKSKTQPERILQTMNRPSHERAKVLAFSWVDTREVRATDSRAIALLNDLDQPVQPAMQMHCGNMVLPPWLGVDVIPR